MCAKYSCQKNGCNVSLLLNGRVSLAPHTLNFIYEEDILTGTAINYAMRAAP